MLSVLPILPQTHDARTASEPSDQGMAKARRAPAGVLDPLAVINQAEAQVWEAEGEDGWRERSILALLEHAAAHIVKEGR